MTTVAVLCGGSSSERDVSLRSGQSVLAALETAGYQTIQIDPAPMNSTQLLEALKGCDVVFPVLHGAGGEDGVPQAWLERHGLNFIGADAAGSVACYDKDRYKQAVDTFGILTPKGALVERDGYESSDIIQNPYVLKPNSGGSSVDTFIVRDVQTADRETIHKAFDTYNEMLLEELISGIEITVGVVNDSALPVIEIIPPADGEFDYENKYNGKSKELCLPEHISSDVQKRAQSLALKIHRRLRIRDMSRTDMIIRSGDNALYVLETNTIPGMTDQSLLPKAAATAGMDMPKLVDTLVQAALSRTGSNAPASTT